MPVPIAPLAPAARPLAPLALPDGTVLPPPRLIAPAPTPGCPVPSTTAGPLGLPRRRTRKAGARGGRPRTRLAPKPDPLCPPLSLRRTATDPRGILWDLETGQRAIAPPPGYEASWYPELTAPQEALWSLWFTALPLATTAGHTSMLQPMEDLLGCSPTLLGQYLRGDQLMTWRALWLMLSAWEETRPPLLFQWSRCRVVVAP